ncbi:hypothetical protein FFF34_009145 [Inquilinus sp. KBS0705]|nr:hypothetical protein FFF34_009145 [Inquilinus sp. KBS0705]
MLLLCGIYACNKPEIKETGAELKYFDLKEYFKKEAARLTKLNPPVNKHVEHNGATESKTVHITNWARELNLFTESDINKPAWKLSYTVDSSATGISYKAKYPELKTRQITISKLNGQVTSIYIVNDAKNILYKTTEKLTYKPDLNYLIEKTQQVKVMGANNYVVKGDLISGGR